VIPNDAQLTSWPKGLPKDWDDLSANEKKIFIRQAEVYAAYLAYTDYEIGRVINAVEKMGKLDNTLIITISGDNGASAEGSPMDETDFVKLRYIASICENIIVQANQGCREETARARLDFARFKEGDSRPGLAVSCRFVPVR
jgi:arylsulfatase A-like enzyme